MTTIHNLEDNNRHTQQNRAQVICHIKNMLGRRMRSYAIRVGHHL